MKVQRCPACGARYNADRLEPGAVFDCNRCGAEVTVESTARPAPGLLLAGLLVLAALFVWNPLAGATGTQWPWELIAEAPSAVVRAATGLWALLGTWALLTALVPSARSRSAVSLALGSAALVLATSTQPFAGFSIDPSRSLAWLLATAALGAGLWLARDGRRSAATLGLLAGGALALIVLASWTFSDTKVVAVQQVVTDLHRLVGGEGAPTGPQGGEGLGVTLARSGSQAIALLAALGGLLVAIGARARGFAVAVVVLLLLAMLLPGAVRIGQALQPGFQWDDLPRIAAHAAGRLLVADGVALWALLALAAADLVQGRTPARGREGVS